MHPDTKGSVWLNTHHTNILQKFGEITWGTWISDEPIWNMRVKQDYQYQKYDLSIARRLFKSVTCWKFWNHQVCMITVYHSWRNQSEKGKNAILFENGPPLKQARNSKCVYNKMPIQCTTGVTGAYGHASRHPGRWPPLQSTVWEWNTVSTRGSGT